MRKIIIILPAILLTANMFLVNLQLSAQAPLSMHYQVVVRNTDEALLQNSLISMRISILQGSPEGTAVYSETHTTNTNSNGLATLEIGGGTGATGDFASINWAAGSYFLKTETDPAGGADYSISGVSPLLSVPYALYARSTENNFTGNFTDLTGKPDFTRWDKDSTDNVNLSGDQTITGNITFTGTVSAGNKAITNVSTPVNNTDAANKAYVDAVLRELDLFGGNCH